MVAENSARLILYPEELGNEPDQVGKRREKSCLE